MNKRRRRALSIALAALAAGVFAFVAASSATGSAAHPRVNAAGISLSLETFDD
jgi:hypothetical protein